MTRPGGIPRVLPRQPPERAKRGWEWEAGAIETIPREGRTSLAEGKCGAIFPAVLDRADLRVPTPRPPRSGISTSVEPVAAARTPAVDHPTAPRAAAGAHRPTADHPPLDELARLRKRVDQQQHSLAVMADAISALRVGSQALRQENRELRLALQATQRSSAGRAEIARREQQALRHRTGS